MEVPVLLLHVLAMLPLHLISTGKEYGFVLTEFFYKYIISRRTNQALIYSIITVVPDTNSYKKIFRLLRDHTFKGRSFTCLGRLSLCIKYLLRNNRNQVSTSEQPCATPRRQIFILSVLPCVCVCLHCSNLHLIINIIIIVMIIIITIIISSSFCHINYHH